jgi:tellurite methyltransferase
MRRAITGFGRDTDNDWFAVLNCGHRQHVRHRPPFITRPWVTTEAGRNARLGQPLNCVRCDRFELPECARPYKRTPVFTTATIPKVLLKDHTTRAGTWATIIVTDGRLRYIVDQLNYERELKPDNHGIVVPELPHRVQPVGDVSFFLKMYRTAAMLP